VDLVYIKLTSLTAAKCMDIDCCHSNAYIMIHIVIAVTVLLDSLQRSQNSGCIKRVCTDLILAIYKTSGDFRPN